jgi:pyruvate dehydrogenase E1 component beta subunit
MAAPRIFRPAARLLSSRIPSSPSRPVFTQSACVPSILRRRTYATETGTKEVTVRDALNEALSEELEGNEKVFILGEEVAQYNGAYGTP